MLIGETWQQLTLFAGDTLASRSVLQEPETAPTMPATFGQNSQTLLGFYDPDTHCWRTCQGTLVSDLATSLQTWPRAGMTRNGIAYQLRPSVPRTFAIAYSLSLHGKPLEWTPTATATANQMAPSMQPRNPGLRLLPTPTAQDAKNSSLPPSQQTRDSIPGELMREGMSGSLNPMWVEWLMGFPTGWTDLEP